MGRLIKLQDKNAVNRIDYLPRWRNGQQIWSSWLEQVITADIRVPGHDNFMKFIHSPQAAG